MTGLLHTLGQAWIALTKPIERLLILQRKVSQSGELLELGFPV